MTCWYSHLEPNHAELAASTTGHLERGLQVHLTLEGQIRAQGLAQIALVQARANPSDGWLVVGLQPGQEEALAVSNLGEKLAVTVSPVHQNQHPMKPAGQLDDLAIVMASMGDDDLVDRGLQQAHQCRQIDPAMGIISRWKLLFGPRRQGKPAGIESKHVGQARLVEQVCQQRPRA